MFDLINGLPVHVLVVHGVAVLVPLTAVGAVAIAVRRGWRVTYGPLLTLISLVATILCPIATASGEELQQRVGDPGRHAELGEWMVWVMIPLTLLVAALTVIERRGPAERARGALGTGLAALTALVAVGAVVLVVLIGDTGARAAWEGRIQSIGADPASSVSSVSSPPAPVAVVGA